MLHLGSRNKAVSFCFLILAPLLIEDTSRFYRLFANFLGAVEVKLLKTDCPAKVKLFLEVVSLAWLLVEWIEPILEKGYFLLFRLLDCDGGKLLKESWLS